MFEMTLSKDDFSPRPRPDHNQRFVYSEVERNAELIIKALQPFKTWPTRTKYERQLKKKKKVVLDEWAF